jgi:hypothetical protein
MFPAVNLISGLLLLFAFFHSPIAAAEDLSAQAGIVAQAERAFSARCAEIGIRDSFLEYLRLMPFISIRNPDWHTQIWNENRLRRRFG